MKIFFALAPALIAHTASALQHATLVTFNNGLDESGKTCSESDWALVQSTIANATAVVGGGRRLNTQSRKLGTCDYCGKYCIKVGNGCVPRPGRRQLESDENEIDNRRWKRTGSGRQLEQDEDEIDGRRWKRTGSGRRQLTECDSDIAKVTTALTNLAPTLAPACRALVASPQRNVTYVRTTEHCFVRHFNLWDARHEFVMVAELPANGTTFCKSRMISFEATTNYFIGKIQWTIRGIRTDTMQQYNWNRTEYSAPYYLNGNSGSNVLGTYLPPGNFTLTATSEDDASQSKSITFRAKNC